MTKILKIYFFFINKTKKPNSHDSELGLSLFLIKLPLMI